MPIFQSWYMFRMSTPLFDFFRIIIKNSMYGYVIYAKYNSRKQLY